MEHGILMYVPADPLLTLRVLGEHPSLEGAAVLAGQIPSTASYYSRGRVALWALLDSLGLGEGDRVLLPAYCCDSVLGPLEALGILPSFYPISERLTPDLDQLADRIDGRVRAVLALHFCGLPTELADLRQLCDARDVWLIEDCAHALYGYDGPRPLGRQGHAAIFSPWKTLPLPDGGILVRNDARLIRPEPLPPPSAISAGLRTAYRVIPTFESAAGWSPRSRLLGQAQLRDSMQDRDRSPQFPRTAMSDLSYQLLQRIDGHKVRAARRANYAYLASAVQSRPYLQLPWADLPEGVCPLGLPVLADRRDAVRHHLLRQGVNVRAYWERLPREVDADTYPTAHHIASRILILPVHQSLSQAQLRHIARSLETVPEGAIR